MKIITLQQLPSGETSFAPAPEGSTIPIDMVPVSSKQGNALRADEDGLYAESETLELVDLFGDPVPSGTSIITSSQLMEWVALPLQNRVGGFMVESGDTPRPGSVIIIEEDMEISTAFMIYPPDATNYTYIPMFFVLNPTDNELEYTVRDTEESGTFTISPRSLSRMVKLPNGVWISTNS